MVPDDGPPSSNPIGNRSGSNRKPPGSVRNRSSAAARDSSVSRLLEASVARSLADAYLFLSDVKNALEIERRLPVEALPPAPEAQAALARRLGYQGRARQRFLEDYRRITHRARLALDRVFYGEDG